MLSQRTRYTIRALLHLADRYGEGPVQLGEIAQAQNLPAKFLTVILSQMRRDGLVDTMRGREGGYWLARPPSEISYGEIVRLTRGSLGLLPCASRLAYEQCKNCISEDKCRLHRAMLLVRDETARILDGLSLADRVEIEETFEIGRAVTRVAIIGGGAAGTLQALHLAKAGIGAVTLIERAREPGRGVAYSTRRAEHLLNVPARRMSAFADDPEHFTRWFAARTGASAEHYAPRMLYGDYLTGLLRDAGIVTVDGEAVDVDRDKVVLADGRTIDADIVILAPGNFKPATPRGIHPERLGALWVDDPWAEGIADGLGPGDVVLLLGTGLTAVDAALTLEAAGFAGRIVALSRRGLAPRAHGPREPVTAPCENLPPNCIKMLRRVRGRTAAIGWRAAVYELRTVTQDLWRRAGLDERRRFLRHLRPWWDVHRHKLAPAVGATIDAMQVAARLSIAAGRLVSAEADGDRAIVRFRARGKDEVEELRVARIVNCTGPEADIARAGEPLLTALLASGRICADILKVGIHVDGECRVVDARGRASETLYAIGPVTKGSFWESVAVPDIRTQAERIAARIAG